MGTEIGQNCVAAAAGKIFNNSPLDGKRIESRIIFMPFLNKHFL